MDARDGGCIFLRRLGLRRGSGFATGLEEEQFIEVAMISALSFGDTTLEAEKVVVWRSKITPARN